MASIQDLPTEGGHHLRVVRAGHDKSADAVAEALAIDGIGAVIVIGGQDLGADARLQARLTQLIGRGLVRAAREAGAIFVTRGGGAGLAALIGRVVADLQHVPPLVGVAPAALVAPSEPAHAGDSPPEAPAPGLSHLVLSPGDAWGRELPLKADLAQALAAGKPVLMVLMAGGPTACDEVLQAVRRRWPVLLVKGSSAEVDALARQWAARLADDDDPVVAEIIADGNLTCLTLADNVGETVETLARQVLRQSGGDSVLRQAWRRFAAIDAAAVLQQRSFLDTQWRILALGVLTVLLAIVHTRLVGAAPADTAAAAGWVEKTRWALEKLIGFVLIVVPIGTSVLIAATNRFKPGKRWVLLRSAAEHIKREIYRYRLRAVGYDADETREKKLSEAIEDITRRLARTEANTTALPLHTGPIPPENAASPRDDGMSHLSTDQYVRLRLEDQLAFFRRKTVALEAQLDRLQWWVLGAGALGTLLAALGGTAVIWITLSTALASAVMTYLSYRQVETTLVGYNQTATDLENILSWWTSLEPDEQAQRDNIEALASHTEQVLADELAGWTQRMSDALEKLRDAQIKAREDRDRSAADDGDLGAVGDARDRAAGGDLGDGDAAPGGLEAGRGEPEVTPPPPSLAAATGAAPSPTPTAGPAQPP